MGMCTDIQVQHCDEVDVAQLITLAAKMQTEGYTVPSAKRSRLASRSGLSLSVSLSLCICLSVCVYVCVYDIMVL